MDMNKAAADVLFNYKPGVPAPQINPAIIAIIIEMIQTLLPILLEQCNKKPAEVPAMAQQAVDKDGFLGRVLWLAARRSVIREIGRADYHEAGGDELLAAVLRTGAVRTGDEIDQLWSSMRPYLG